MLRHRMTRPTQAKLVADLTQLLSRERVSVSTPDMVTYSADFWPKTQIWKQVGEVEQYPPDCVVWPESTDEIGAIVRYCVTHKVPVIPFGGGSGVCGGVVPVHGGVSVDVKRMRHVVEVDHVSHTVTAQAGINGQHLEDHLNAEGFTLGHFPSSIMCSTLGGWLAARSAGQYSSRYGKIEDMVMSLRAVLPDGTQVDTAQRAIGEPDWTQLIVGSEGTLGFITEATLRIHPKPEARALRGFKFDHLHEAIDAMRLVMQAGLQPMVLRLYDPFDTVMALGKKVTPPEAQDTDEDGAKQRSLLARLKQRGTAYALSVPGVVNRVTHMIGNSCLLIIGFEGPERAVQRSVRRSREILAEAGGRDAGAGPGEAWLAKRYAVSFKQSRIYQSSSFVDTMEVATTWDRLEALYDAVVRAVTPHALIMAHFSHAYREGCSIYFTFAAHKRHVSRSEAAYDQIWQAALGAVQGIGATASHHHGVGLSKMGWMVEEHGEMLRVWRALKSSMDADGLLNPGKLFPEPGGDA